MKINEISPLEYSTLSDIHEKNRTHDRNPAVHLLLKEIARLHQIVRDIDRNYQSMRPHQALNMKTPAAAFALAA